MVNSPLSPNNGISIDPILQQQEDPSKKNSPVNSNNPSPEDFSSPHPRLDCMDEFIHLGGEFVPQESGYQDMMIWQDYSLGLDMYSGPMHLEQAADVPIHTFPELSDLSSSSEVICSSRGSINTRSTSISITTNLDEGMLPEFEVVLAAEAGWPLARCNPSVYSGACPRTAIVHLEALERKSREEGTWDALDSYIQQIDWDALDLASVVPIDTRAREHILAVTQNYLHKALEIHRGGVNGQNQRYASPAMVSILVLPPSRILEYFLRTYARNLSFFYPLITTGRIDPNDTLHQNHAFTLLLLLMIAQGASVIPTTEARALSTGLIETCRISLFDIIEKDVEMCADPIVLRSALLFTLLGAWSGDKWLMDIAMGQRGMYLSVSDGGARGSTEKRRTGTPRIAQLMQLDINIVCTLLIVSPNRLVYNWVMVDQELSLFHDTAPLLSVSELLAPLPGPERLWTMTNGEAWLAATQSLYGCTANVNPQLLSTPSLTPSLHDLFQDFLHDNLSRRQGGSPTPHQLRLLLHPLQALLCQLRQLLSCFSDVLLNSRGGGGGATRTVTKASTLLRLEEVQTLLQKWYQLSRAHADRDRDCDGIGDVVRANLALYHLIALNAVTSFPEVERLARRESFDGSYWELSLRHKRCIYQREEAVFHCGQVFRIVTRLMPTDRRPSWWAAALYRATLVLFVDSVSQLDPSFQKQRGGGGDDGGSGGSSCTSVSIDRLLPEDPLLKAYVWKGDGIPVLTRPHGIVSIENPKDVLGYAIKSLEEGGSLRMADGIRRKLITLGSNWDIDGFRSHRHRS
ncbi:hypothetical protein SLS62_003258 [Diatrype stigma]|uniref:Transcription factor domain-containing protein n=1 Tax=Diatrype stigma TaxID=117547 RepID=A0AAN9YRI2_9PEZI